MVGGVVGGVGVGVGAGAGVDVDVDVPAVGFCPHVAAGEAAAVATTPATPSPLVLETSAPREIRSPLTPNTRPCGPFLVRVKMAAMPSTLCVW